MAETIRLVAAAGVVGGSIAAAAGDSRGPIHPPRDGVDRFSAAAGAAPAFPSR